jgi:hypothetical protein
MLACEAVSLDTDPEAEPMVEPDRRSAYFDVFLDPDARACSPTLERLDAELERLSSALGVGVDSEEPIELHYGGQSVDERCRTEPDVLEYFGGGCTDEDGRWIAAQPGVEGHGIVHALRRRAGLVGPGYWEEGLATYLGTWRPYAPLRVWAAGEQDPSASLRSGGHLSHVDHLEAAHFIAYLEETHGADDLRWLSRLLGEGADPGAAIEEVFEATLEDVEMRWLAEADRMYELGPLCDEHIAVGADLLVLHGEIGCEIPGVLGPGMDAEVDTFQGPRYCFDTPDATTLTVTVRGSEEHGVVQARSITTERGCPAYEPNLGADIPAGRTLGLETQGCRWSVMYLSGLEGDVYEIELSLK